MSIPTWFVDYTTPPTNYLGTAIFLSYILLALYATANITHALYSQYTTIVNTTRQDAASQAALTARLRHIKIYAFLASLSFAMLSYHMLFFLITHYLAWAGEAHGNSSAVTVRKVTSWMMQSTLFRDFMVELVQDKGSAVVTQISVLGTWYWNIWMARKARARQFNPSTMRNFILLTQILPCTLPICMFLTHLHFKSPDIQPPETPKAKSQSLPTRKRNTSMPIASLQLPNILLNISLLALPALRKHSIATCLLLLGRAILLLPHLGLIISLDERAVDKSMVISAGFVMASQWMGRKDAGLGSEMRALLHGGFAVRAMGWDAVLGAVVGLCLSWGGGV